MANYDSNYAIAQEISARIGVSPIPFDSVYSIALEIYNELGGEPAEFDSVYSILLGILPLVEGGVASKVIDDNVITTAKTWSSSKIFSELANAGFDTEIVQSLPVSGDAHTIYFVPASESGATDGYDEFMWINSQWEQVGSTRLDLSDYYTSAQTNTLLAGKQDIINDLDTIRSGASLGMTALQSVPSEYITDTELSTELSGYATTSALTNGLSSKQDTLSAGSNITISGNTISATDTTYSAGSGITISGTSVSVDSSLLSEINGKQDELTAGTNITISGTTISATYEVATNADIEALFS